MKLNPVTIEEVRKVPKNRHDMHRNSITEALNQFLASGKEAALVEVTPSDYTSVHSAYTSFYRALKAGEYPVQAEIRSGALYLYRTNI